MLQIKEVEMVDSLDELKSSRSVYGKAFPNFEMLDGDCLGSEQDHPEFPIRKEGQPRGAESSRRGPVSTRETDRLHDLRLLIAATPEAKVTMGSFFDNRADFI